MSENEQNLQRMEEFCRGILADDGANQAAIDAIILDLRPRMLRIFDATPPVPIDAPPEIAEKIRDLFNRNSRACTLQLLRLEVEFYWEAVGDPRTPLKRQIDLSAPTIGARAN